jgi:hypothetical protein
MNTLGDRHRNTEDRGEGCRQNCGDAQPVAGKQSKPQDGFSGSNSPAKRGYQAARNPWIELRSVGQKGSERSPCDRRFARWSPKAKPVCNGGQQPYPEYQA